jgi:quinol monooxygenase YgiN
MQPRAAPSPEAATQMILYRVTVQVREARLDRARLLLRDLVRASRAVPGVISFDILQDPDNSARFVSIEVYENQAALDRQAVLPELDTLMAELDDLLTDGPEGTRFQVFAAQPWPTA